MFFNKILNYGVRIFIILVGLVLALGLIKARDSEQNFIFRIMGIIITLFGFYRIIMYRSNLRYFKSKDEDEDEDGEQDDYERK